MAGATFLNIPGNIKQKKLPFVLDPSNKINTADVLFVKDEAQAVSDIQTEPTLGDDFAAQMFSFKPNAFGDDGPTAAKSGFLRIAPASIYSSNSIKEKLTYADTRDDLSYSLLYNNTLANKDGVRKQASIKNILNSLPSVTVREYLQDSKLNNVINLFKSFFGGITKGNELSEKFKDKSFTELAKKFWQFSKDVIQNVPEIVRAAADSVVSYDDFMLNYTYDTSINDYVLRVPFLLYYRMISATTTNIYQLPYNGKILYQSDGVQGWNRDNGFGNLGVEGGSIVGSLINYVVGNIKVNTTPTWTPVDQGTPVKVEMTFDLYNDNIYAALKNFIFINTIIPGNKFMQYHIYQHAPNLYDVRIDGINRLFMCAATFKCDMLGVLRQPSKKFLEVLLQKHCNTNGFKDKIKDEKTLCSYIRIPDVYRVTASFESLLPDSYNNYIYQYYINQPIERMSGQQLRTQSAYEKFAQGIASQISSIANEIFNDGKKDNNENAKQ